MGASRGPSQGGAPEEAQPEEESRTTGARNTNKTRATKADVGTFIDSVDTSAVRRSDARVLLDIMAQETGQQPVMWGPTIIGFGSYHYRYPSGREGDAAAVGFSPRKAQLVIYGVTSAPGVDHVLERLGKFKRGSACLYINQLADIGLDVLRELIRAGYRHMTTQQSDPQGKQNG